MTPGKPDLRLRILAKRRAIAQPLRAVAGSAIRQAVLDLLQVDCGQTFAAYVSVGTEPPTPSLIQELRERGGRVLTPVLRPDLDLDWAVYDEQDDDARAEDVGVGLREPRRERLGIDAITEADAIIVPALAVDVRGVRLGRGGGSYDRALLRVDAYIPVIALLYDGEVLPDVPAEAHDRRVGFAVTPSRTWCFSQEPRGASP